MVDLNLTLVGWVHTVACVIAMAAFVPVMVVRKGGRRHQQSGRIFSVAYAAVCVTSLGIYRQQQFWFPHWLAVGGLIVLLVGYLAVRIKPPAWRYIHLSAMLLSGYNLFGGAVNEAYLRIRPLRSLAGDNILGSQLVGMTHGVVMLVFVALIVGCLTVTVVGRSRREPTAHPLS